ncbi:MAG: guanylate kinase [Mycoplasmataceae bacterium]|nr:guanylate kinase [Mycoplasmataceae bacterium]
MERQIVFILSGPSGVGKDTLLSKIIAVQELNIVRNVTYTTREQRGDELNGKNYNFVTIPQFEKMIKDNKFLEWTIYSKNYYGTQIDSINKLLKEKKNVITILEVDGTEQILKKYGDQYNICTIFLLPPSTKELRNRLIERGMNNEDDLERRLKIAETEINKSHFYNYKIIMDNMEREIDTICNYMLLELAKLNKSKDS